MKKNVFVPLNIIFRHQIDLSCFRLILTDLLNLMNFLRLRADHHAQYEIRAYADVMLDTVKKWVPITYEAFMDYRVGGTEVSAKGKEVLKKLIKGVKVDMDQSGLSKREWNELMEAFDLKDNLI